MLLDGACGNVLEEAADIRDLIYDGDPLIGLNGEALADVRIDQQGLTGRQLARGHGRGDLLERYMNCQRFFPDPKHFIGLDIQNAHHGQLAGEVDVLVQPSCWISQMADEPQPCAILQHMNARLHRFTIELKIDHERTLNQIGHFDFVTVEQNDFRRSVQLRRGGIDRLLESLGEFCFA